LRLNILIYIACNFLLLHLIGLESDGVNQVIYILCGLGILTLGIAHGAIDHILYGVKSRQSNLYFISVYLLVILIFAGTWILFPNLALTFFLVVSAYHFGQSQFVEYAFRSNLLNKVIFLSWGGMILFQVFYFNSGEILDFQKTYLSQTSILVHLTEYAGYYLLGCSVFFFASFLTIAISYSLSWNALLKETYIILLITVSMYIFPAFVAFSLFFVWIHSFKVMTQEFQYCKDKLKVKKLIQFVRLLMPLSLVSIFGTVLILLLAFQFDKTYLIPYILLILLSCITMPHSFVMEEFYRLIAHQK